MQVSRADELRQIAENEDLMAIWFKAEQNIELTDTERNRLFGMLVQRFVQWEWYYEQYEEGLIRYENIQLMLGKALCKTRLLEEKYGAIQKDYLHRNLLDSWTKIFYESIRFWPKADHSVNNYSLTS